MKKISLVLLCAVFLAVFPVLTQISAVVIENPVKYNKFEDLINALINWLYALALVVVPGVIVLAGYFFITSQGDPAKVTLARNMVIYALIGLAIIIASRGIIALIKQIVGAS